MPINLLLLLIPAIVIPFVFRLKYRQTITNVELLAQLAIGAFAVIIVYALGISSQTADFEIINGQVTGKAQVRTSCSHSYSCNCTTTYSGSGSNRTSHRTCQTCYEHPYDYDWEVYADVGNFTIDRVNRRGDEEPPRWSVVRLGQPVALEHGYTNYVKGAPASLFHHAAILTSYQDKIPAYPRTYDYHFANRVIGVGIPVPHERAWNYLLAQNLRVLGPSKQANVIIVLTNEPSRLYAQALRQAWLGGKKNDVVVVIGTPRYPEIGWVDVFSWSKSDYVNVALRNALMEQKTLNPGLVTRTIAANVSDHYVRRPMADYEYLKNDVRPATWVMVLAFLLATIGSIGLGVLFHRNDHTN